MVQEEAKRLKQVSPLLNLELGKGSEFQDIVNLAAQLCEMPISLITLIDKQTILVKAKHGVDIDSMPKDVSFCQYATQQKELFVIPDTINDDRFAENPLVQSGLKLRFYASTPLTLSNGSTVGTLCVFDHQPNNLNPLQKHVLTLLGKQAVAFMELELSQKNLEKQIEEKEAKNQSLMKIAQLQSHQIRQPLTTIMGLVNLIKNGDQTVDDEWLELLSMATANFDTKIQEVVAETMASKDLKAIRFNRMIEEIDDYAILLLDRDGNVENWNKGAEKIKGYSTAEIIGKHFSVFYTPEDKQHNRPQKLINEAIKNRVARDEGWRVRKNGTHFWGSIVITAIHDYSGNVIGFTKVTRDLTDITDTRESLNASNTLYNELLEQTSQVARIGGWELDLTDSTLSWSSITREIHEVDDDYIPNLENGINFYKEGESRDKISEAVKLAIEEGKPWDLELQLITQKGKEIWVRSIGKSNYKNGVCTKVYGTFQDINASKSETLNISRSRKQYKDVVDAASEVSIIAANIDGIITLFNSGAEKMLGYTASELVGTDNFALFHSAAEIKQRSAELTKEYGFTIDGFKVFIHKVETEGAEQRAWTYIRKDGTEIKVSLTVTSIRNADNEVTGYLGMATVIA